MIGKLSVLVIVLAAAIGGIAMYFLQVHAFYDDVPADSLNIEITSAATGRPVSIIANDVQAIDAESSPLRFRACFNTPLSQEILAGQFAAYDRPVPLTGPGWFNCYDAKEVGRALEAQDAIAYLGESDIHDRVDRVVAIFDDGRGFAWHQLNEEHRN